MTYLDAEVELARQSYTSTLDLLGVSVFADLPLVLEGKVIVDIGSGASTAVSELEQLGALAVGLDYRYDNFKILKRSLDKYLNQPNMDVELLELMREIKKRCTARIR